MIKVDFGNEANELLKEADRLIRELSIVTMKLPAAFAIQNEEPTSKDTDKPSN